jgi:AraC family transcriptional regulator of adaptative response/methylated-DNA-[protein]-cysteine methyltransferase
MTTLATQLDLFLSADERWRAVEERLPEAEGFFLYAVETTGVVCRPTCKSRRPNRANVRFFDSLDDAEAAGFRACLRCKPGDVSHDARQRGAIAKACRRLEAAETEPSLEELAAEADLSASRFQRLFTSIVGTSPKEYAAALRRERVREALADGETVSDAIFQAGYGASSRFYEGSRDTLGMDASAYRRGAPGEAIRFASARTSLGWLVAARTAKGVCFIALGDERGELVDDLRGRFGEAASIDEDATLGGLMERVVSLIDAPDGAARDRGAAALPLDIRGTAFQHRVWKALREIPAGSTISYAELAERIGAPKAVRAVAGACGANPVAVAVPCHRVARGDGSLGGYHWGVGRKRKLLEKEGAKAAEK